MRINFLSNPQLNMYTGIPTEELTKHQLLDIISKQQQEIIELKSKLNKRGYLG